MKKFVLAVTAALGICAFTSHASAAILDSGAIEGNSDFATIDHWYFTVNTEGLIQIDVTDTIPENDFEMNLLFARGGSLGSFIENDDDDGPGTDPRIEVNLAAGNYALLVGLYVLRDNATGFRNVDVEQPSSPYDLSISGDTSLNFVREGNLDGSFDERGVSPVALPAAGWPMFAGLGGLAAMRRKKKAA